MKNITIDNGLKDILKDFFGTIDVSYKFMDGWSSLNDTELLVNCLVYQMETGQNILQEYIDIQELSNKYIDFDRFVRNNKEYGYWQYEYRWDDIREKSIQEIDGLLNKKGYWKLSDSTRERLEHTRQLLENTDENPLGKTYKQAKRQEILDRYYNYKNIPCDNEVEKAKEDIQTLELFPLGQVPSKIDFYPLILMVFDENRNISNMFKVEKNLEGKLERLSEKYPEHTYGYLPMDERVIEHVFTTLCVYYNPIDLSISAFSYRQSPYKSINTIKDRYKGELGINLRIIKKVCAMYKIDIHYLNNSITVIDRNKINQALSEYTGRDSTKHPDLD